MLRRNDHTDERSVFFDMSVRAFDSDDVVHVECLIRQRTAPHRGPFSSKCSCVLNDHDQCNRQEQVRDLETIQAELCLEDLQL
jgi:hypothetical protein